MYRTFHLLPLLLLAAAPAAAQEVIRPGQSVSGRLSASDPTLDDGSHYDVWRFAGEARHRYRITLRSDDFDAYLSVGSTAQAGCDDCATDDDGAGGTGARVEFTGPMDGTFEIRANSLDEGRTGAYELTLEDEGVVDEEHEHGESAEMGTPIGLDQPVTGELGRGDRKMGHSYADTWTYQGREGETIIVTVRSDDFDTYVTAGAFEDGECTELDANDNDAGGTDSRLRVELPEDGAFHLHVTSVDQGDTGAYTLLIERGVERLSNDLPMPIAPGETLNGRLGGTDTQEADGSYRDAWTFRGRAGETFVITLRSDDFDAFLQVGRMSGDAWEVLMTDDDGGGESDSELTLTLPDDGEYVIRAGSYDAEETGAYTLSLHRP